MDAPKDVKRRGRPPKYSADAPVVEGAESDSVAAPVVTEPAEVVIRAPEGLDEFLGRVDRWQAANHDARIVSARFPGADRQHVNVFNGFRVSDGPAGVTLSSGETLEI